MKTLLTLAATLAALAATVAQVRREMAVLHMSIYRLEERLANQTEFRRWEGSTVALFPDTLTPDGRCLGYVDGQIRTVRYAVVLRGSIPATEGECVALKKEMGNL